ncbi:MAG: hypothetical protein JNM56_19310 [Planctomycetia bacterium]|nr:hypothetical protein [Planctomycetia bacterium]
MLTRKRVPFGCLCLALVGYQAQPAAAQMFPALQRSTSTQPVVYMTQAPATPQAPAAPTTPQAPGRPTPEQMAQAPQAPAAGFGEAAPAGTEGTGSYAPQMLGDSLFISPVTAFNLNPALGPIGPVTPTIGQGSSGSQTAKIDSAGISGIKIADNESPRPEDRAGMAISYFTGVFHSLIAPAFGENRIRVTRLLLNYEKTCLDGDVSFGIRVPFFQVNTSGNAGDDSVFGFPAAASSSTAAIGDISLVAKAILASSEDESSLFVGGLVLTIPTGPSTSYSIFTADDDTIITDTVGPTIWQPYIGYLIQNTENVYVHGFSSLAFSMDDTFPTVWFNDIGVGVYLYRGARTTIVGTTEAHLTTPLENRGSQNFPVGALDVLVNTWGAHLISDNGSRFTIGAGYPLTGPKPFTWELMFQFNYAL